MTIILDGSTGIITPGDLTVADKIVHSGDTNTAIRFPAADTVSVETSGIERLRVDSTGNVGIGTSSPTVALDVVGTVKSTAVTTDSINSIPLQPGILDPENRIINGAFDFWQRGTSFTTNFYGADRWFNLLNTGTVTQSRQAFTIGDVLGSNNPTYFLRQTVSGQSAAVAYALTIQKIEGVRSYAGQTITVLGWARRSSGSGNMAVEGEQNFGTGGSPSSPVTTIPPTTVTLAGSFAPFAVVMTVPSITGKTLGANGNDSLAINFWTSAGSDYNARTNSLGIQTIGVDLWGIHIKVGTHTTDAVNLYRQPELGPELARCQRYCHVIDTGTLSTAVFARLAVGGLVTSSTTTQFPIQFPVIMRAVPSFVSSNITNAVVYNGGGNQTVSSASIDQSGRFLFNISVTHTAGFTQGQSAQLTRNNGASPAPSLTFDAEL